jgi:23S rRNA (cytosine1962-C5)-methyltransferase
LKSRIYSPSWDGYELIDLGGGEKLERWGNTITIRPELNAYFKPVLSKQEWYKQADFQFIEEKKTFGIWKKLSNKPLHWTIQFEELALNVCLKDTKHTGIFPEQRINWDKIKSFITPDKNFLNLFAYTGISSLVARAQGADVIHVDSSKSALTRANENQVTNGLSGCKLVLEDAMLFMQREIKRKHQYDIIQMDPPAWGIGTQGKKWQLENHIDELIHNASQLLREGGILITSTYSPKLTAPTLHEIAEFVFPLKTIQTGILCTKSTTGKTLEHGNLLLVS